MNMKDLPTYLNFGKKSKDLYESVSRPRTKGIGLEKSSCDVNDLLLVISACDVNDLLLFIVVARGGECQAIDCGLICTNLLKSYKNKIKITLKAA